MSSNDPSSAWKAIADMMRDKNLDAFADEMINILYSKDGALRYVIFKDENGMFSYQLEAIHQYIAGEWKFIRSADDAFPALWEPFDGIIGSSVFESESRLLEHIKSTPEYREYFV